METPTVYPKGITGRPLVGTEREVEHGGETYRLVPASAFYEEYELRIDGRFLCRIYRYAYNLRGPGSRVSKASGWRPGGTRLGAKETPEEAALHFLRSRRPASKTTGGSL